MKLKLLTAAIAAVATFSASAQADGPSFYGKANLTLNNYDIESSSPEVDNWELESNSSRLGVKGSVPINDKLQAIYKMEFEIYLDDGKSSESNDEDTFEQRNIYVGLQGDFGTVIAGKHDTPTKLAQSKIDKFNDMPLADIKNLFEGENRESNIVMYSTPKFGNVSVTSAFIPGEEDESGDNDGLADGISVAVSYQADSLYLAVAADDDVDDRDTVRLVAEYTLGDAMFGFLYQTAEKSDSNNSKEDEDGFLFSGEYKLNSMWVIKGQFGFNDIETDTEDRELTQLTFGADYKLSKASKVFGYFSTIETDQDSGDTDDSTFAVGYELKF